MIKSCDQKLKTSLYIMVVMSFIGFIYYFGIYILWFKRMPLTSGSTVFLVIFHIIFILFLWSFWTCVLTDPGRVPLYWGFFLDDPEHKKRRYCLICHIFKPERCHHCSTCNRCVLNMDHHCPWIGNCVGFYNRKFFILMLFYTILTTFILTIAFIRGIMYSIDHQFLVTPSSHKHTDSQMEKYVDDVFILIAFACNLTFLIVISMFSKFHLDLLLSNSTTIENLDKKRSNLSFGQVNYDMGYYFNWVQVMGKNPFLWFVPLFFQTGKPVGDGVLWPQKQQNQETQQANM